MFFGNVLPYQDDVLPKTKMVRMVHMNIFYRMDLEIYDSKSELWTQTENLGFEILEIPVLGPKIDFSRFWADFIKKNIFIYGDWAGMIAE